MKCSCFNVPMFAICISLTIAYPQSNCADEVRDETETFPADEVVEVRGQAMLLDLGFSRSGKWLAAVGDSVRIFDPRSAELLTTIATPTTTRYVHFSPTVENRFATAGDDGNVRIYEVGKAKPQSVIAAHPGRMVSGLAHSPDGAYLATSSEKYDKGEIAEGEFTVWDLKSREPLLAKRLAGTTCKAVAFSPDGARFAVALSPGFGPKSTVEIYDTKRWKLTNRIEFSPGFALAMDFSPDGKTLVIAGGECEDRNAQGCNPTGKLWIARLDSDEEPTMLRPKPRHDYFRSLSFSKSGNSFVTGTSKMVREPRKTFLQAELQSRDTRSGKLRWSAKGGIGDAYGANLSPDGILAAYCIDERIYFVDGETGEHVHKFDLK